MDLIEAINIVCHHYLETPVYKLKEAIDKLEGFKDSLGISRNKDLPLCLYCKNPANEDYMVHDIVWDEAISKLGTRRGFLHLQCLEEVLGRELRSDDFKPLNYNNALLYFLGKLERANATSNTRSLQAVPRRRADAGEGGA